MKQIQEAAQFMAAIKELESELPFWLRAPNHDQSRSIRINEHAFWSHDPLYLIVGVNTLIPDHAGYRHAHRYFFWKRKLDDQYLHYFLSCDIEAFERYGDIDLYFVSDSGCGGRINHSITAATRSELSVESLCSDLIRYQWRSATASEFDAAIERTLLDDIDSSNCRIRRGNKDMLNAVPFFITGSIPNNNDVRAIRGSTGYVIEHLEKMAFHG